MVSCAIMAFFFFALGLCGAIAVPDMACVVLMALAGAIESCGAIVFVGAIVSAGAIAPLAFIASAAEAAPDASDTPRTTAAIVRYDFMRILFLCSVGWGARSLPARVSGCPGTW